jgi:hypothetical protein
VETSEFAEVIVECDPADAQRVEAWLAEHGLSADRMRLGVLATGGADRVEAAFGAGVGDRSASRSLPIPPELAGAVRSVTVVPIPRSGA